MGLQSLALLLLALRGAATDRREPQNTSLALVRSAPSFRQLTGDRRRLSGQYAQIAKLAASDAGVKGGFGYSMAIDGDTIVVGAYYGSNNWKGSTYVFLTTDGGATYGQVAKLTASDGAASDYFGYSVAISGGTVVVGAYWDDDGGYSSGSVYVFSGAGSEGLVAGSDSTQTLGSDAATRTGPLLALLVAAVLAL